MVEPDFPDNEIGSEGFPAYLDQLLDSVLSFSDKLIHGEYQKALP